MLLSFWYLWADRVWTIGGLESCFCITGDEREVGLIRVKVVVDFVLSEKLGQIAREKGDSKNYDFR